MMAECGGCQADWPVSRLSHFYLKRAEKLEPHSDVSQALHRKGSDIAQLGTCT